MSEQLKPCPFCGKATEKTWCNNPECLIVIANNSDAWNNRPIEDALNAEIARLNDEIKAQRKLANFWRDKCETIFDKHRWIPVGERYPETKQTVEVVVLTDRGKRYVTLAEYISVRTVLAEDYLLDDGPVSFSDYDEKNDIYWTPNGFYEYHYMADMNYFIDDTVTHWRSQPQPPEDDK